jgi:CheY-like chemotaxis protein/two-component sensor histidine kinase
LKREVSERERAEAALVQAQKMEAVGQLTGGIAHDFNNLLQAMSGTLDLIAKSPDDPAKVRRWAERGMMAAERGTRLTGQLLAFSRVQQLDLQPMEVAPLIDDLLELFSRTLGTGVQVRTELHDRGAAVIADKTQLELALLNLAINARDAMPGGGTLTISTRLDAACDPEAYPDGCVEISVKDTGSGMPQDVLERAFEPFFTTKGVGKGTGLGLSMVYGVAAQSGGETRIESSPGTGTTVTILLRRASRDAVAEEESGSSEPVRAGAGETILVVDDDPDVREAITGALEMMGYRIEEAEDGEAAIAKLREARPALALLDFAMPGMNGAEVAAEARRLHPGLPIIFASGFADTEALKGAVGQGMPMLRKPFQMSELAAAVAKAIGRAS